MKQISRCSILSVLLCVALPTVALAQDVLPGPEPSITIAPDVEDEPELEPLVPFSTIVTLLPEAPPGWESETEDLSSSSVENYTGAERSYWKGDGSAVKGVQIDFFDYAGAVIYEKFKTMDWDEPRQFPKSKSGKPTKSRSGKPIVIRGCKGYETYDTDTKEGTLELMIKHRFFVKIETIGLEAGELQKWARRIDLEKFATLK